MSDSRDPTAFELGVTDPKQGPVQKWRRALEHVGVEFIDENESSDPGVLLKKVRPKTVGKEARGQAAMSGNTRSLLRMIESRAKKEAEADAEITVARELALTAADAALGSALKILRESGHTRADIAMWLREAAAKVE
jgi:hypothetical protein